ncbi:MAG: BNR-4 repeat-containing protein, partial [Cytophaga sp.]|nr:BNR-4 repeat-containing protein [Undibacterium sp.]
MTAKKRTSLSFLSLPLSLFAHFVLVCSYSLCFAAAVNQPTGCLPLPSALKIDQSWGGTAVRFGAVESTSAIYIGYYDSYRWLAVSQIDKCTGQVKKIRLNSRFLGWDAHNYVTLALDKQGLVHLAGNMHVSPLVYARMAKPDDLESLTELGSTTGASQDRTTYPRFFRLPDDALGFSYRYGQSGNGVEIIERFDGAAWKRLLDHPLFAPVDGQMPVNAYPTDYVMGPDGYFHVAWVWRVGLVETNFNVNYARSKDLQHWENSNGKALPLPITPNNAELVDPVPQGQGLFNNIQLGFDGDARPVISYLKFDDKGASQLFHARRESDGWKIHQSTRWTYRWDPRGGGTIPSEISFSGLVWRDGVLVERVTQPEAGSNVTLNYDPNTLAN